MILRDFVAKAYTTLEVEDIWEKYKLSLRYQQVGIEGLFFFENA